MREIYIVSDAKDRIHPVEEDIPSEYPTAEAAGDAIKDGLHGEYGTRYVLKVSITAVAEYSRSWTMVRKPDGHEHVFPGYGLDAVCVGSASCTMTYQEYLSQEGKS